MELTGYRLPTEAEWEYACPAGAGSSRNYGVTEALLPRYAWYQANSNDRTHPVSRLKPNDFGLFDIQGNVAEWCDDEYVIHATSTEEAASDKPSLNSIENAGSRVLRGGSFDIPMSVVRSAVRIYYRPGDRDDSDGFRPARTYHISP